MHVRGIAVLGEVGVQDLGDAHELRSPRPHPLHVRNVQDPADRRGDAEVMDEPIRFETKVAVVVRDDLETWQRLNVTAFLVSGVTAAFPELVGEPYEDPRRHDVPPTPRPAGRGAGGGCRPLRVAQARALARQMAMSVYTAGMFGTGNDRDNRAVVRAVGRDELDLVGLALHGPRNGVDKAVKGARLHP